MGTVTDRIDRSEMDSERDSARALRRVGADPLVRQALRDLPFLARAFEAAARRFVVGRDRGEALDRVREWRREGIRASLDFMGEDTRDAEEVDDATKEFLALVADIARLGDDTGVSINLSHVGLAIDPGLAEANCRRIAAVAGQTGTEVVINMEGDAYRESILEIYLRLASSHPNLGITLQACLERTTDDLEACLEVPGRIRLVKGAYDELGATGIRGEPVDRRFGRLADRLLGVGHRCAIATHDPRLLERAAEKVSPGASEAVEFEMLCGVAPHRLRRLRDLGHRTRLYAPYGSEFLLYVCHRLAEHPPNLHRAVRDVVVELLGRVDDERAASPQGSAPTP